MPATTTCGLGAKSSSASSRAPRPDVSDKALAESLKRLKQASVEDLLVHVGQGLLTAAEVLEAVYPGLGKKAPKRKPGAKAKAGANPIPIKGLTPGLAVHMADCCHPLPGDRIVGIIVPGKGTEVHTIDCKTLDEYQDRAELWQDLSWEPAAEEEITSVARIRALLLNEPGALGGLANTISDHGGNITNLKISERKSDLFEFIVDVEVRDAKHLNHILAALRASPLVSLVRRVGA